MPYGLLDGDGYHHGAVKHGAKQFTCFDYRYAVTHQLTALRTSGDCSRANSLSARTTAR